MYNRRSFVVGLVLLTTACATGGPEPRNLPVMAASLAATSSIAIVDEGDAVVLQGTFADADGAGDVTRTANLTGSAAGATGLATIGLDRSDDGPAIETLTLVVDGLKYPSLFHLVLDGRNVAVFSTTLTGRAEVRYARGNPPSN